MVCRVRRRAAAASGRWRSTRLAGSLSAVGIAVLLAQMSGLAAPSPITLPYSNGYLVTGNFVVGSVDLQPQSGGNGFLTSTINMTGTSAVPENAEILGAFLYWETITSADSQLDGVKFRGLPVLDAVNVGDYKDAAATLTGPTAACWGAGGGSGATYTMHKMRADVRRLLPLVYDANGKSTGKRLVNDADLLANGYALHTVTLPEAGTGNLVPQSAGASLVVIYRDPSEPLRKIVVYDGIAIMPNLAGATMSQTIQGIYQSSALKSAKMTHIVGSGQPNGTDRLFFKGAGNEALVASNPFPGTSNASDRSWSTLTLDSAALSSSIPGATNVNDGYGEFFTTRADHTSTAPYDCLSWNAIIFSAAVKDDDRDGIPDGVEDAVGGLKYDADGAPLPNLPALGASSAHKDILIEMDAMRAAAGTSYGSANAPYNSSQSLVTVTDNAGHIHLPTPAALKIVADAYRNAPVLNSGWSNADGSSGIWPHFDVGNIDTYHQLFSGGAATDVDPYLVPSAEARGGELIPEQSCGLGAPPCRFQNFPGTVGWLGGFLDYAKLHFDSVREGLFHYVLYVHARAKPKSQNPCLDPATGTNANGTCNVVNPDYYVPSSTSGIAQLPGNKAMISLGLWDKDTFVGTPELVAGTTLHELGHNVGLFHGGASPVWNATSKLLEFEPNCKPDYTSVMSYLFQVPGLRDDNGIAHFDYSRDTNDAYHSLNESSLSDAAFSPSLVPYRTAWYAPLVPGTLGYVLGASPAKKFCGGEKFPNPLPASWVAMGRIDGPGTSDTIDWNGDGDLAPSAPPQDINFDGVLNTAPLRGFDDWSNIRLDQTGGGKNAAGFSSGTADAAEGTADMAEGTADAAEGTADAAEGTADAAEGTADAAEGAELDLQAFNDLGHAPANHFAACVIGTASCTGTAAQLHRVKLSWDPPFGGDVASYTVYRSTGTTIKLPLVTVGTTTDGKTTTLVDSEELPNNVQFTYFVKVTFADGGSGVASNPATITAIDSPPVAVNDAYSVPKNTPLVLSPRGVLKNDTDADSPGNPLTALLVTGPLHGTLTLNADGSFTYTPVNGYAGADSFSYKATDGVWSRDATVPLSGNSSVATVTMTVGKK